MRYFPDEVCPVHAIYRVLNDPANNLRPAEEVKRETIKAGYEALRMEKIVGSDPDMIIR